MKRHYIYLLLLIELLCLTAQGATEADKDSLRALKTTYENAIKNGDIQSLTLYLADEFTGVMVTGEAISGMDGLLDYWTTLQSYLGKNGTYTVELIPNDTLFVDSMAMASGSTKEVVTTSSGQTFEFTSEWTAIAQKEGDNWRLVRIQATMDPINNPFIEKIGLLKLTTVAGSSALVAAVLAGFLMHRRKRG